MTTKMKKSFNVKIYGKTLKIYREFMRVDLAELARSTKIPVDKLRRIEEGIDNTLTFNQLEKIAKVLKRPIVAFFLKPEEIPESIKKGIIDKRQITYSKQISYNTMKLISEALSIQYALFNLKKKNIYDVETKLKYFTLEDDPQEAAKYLNELLNLDDLLAQSMHIRELFNEIRRKLFLKGILVFHYPIDPMELRGAALLSLSPPIIIISSKDKEEAKIFTLLHELAHILLGEKSNSIEYPDMTHFENRKFEEAWCNRVASYALLPSDKREKIKKLLLRSLPRINESSINTIVNALSRKYKVSKTFIRVVMLSDFEEILPPSIKKYLKETIIKKIEPKQLEKETKKGFRLPKEKEVISKYSKEYVRFVASTYYNHDLNLSQITEVMPIKRKYIPAILERVV